MTAALARNEPASTTIRWTPGHGDDKEYHGVARLRLLWPPDMADKPKPAAEESPVPAEPEHTSGAESSFALLLRARGGDEDALERLCARYLPRLERWAHGRLPVWARGALETQDLAQETLIQAIGKLPTFEPRHEGAFQAYLRQALLNRIRDEVRRARRRGPADSLNSRAPAADPSPLEQAIGQETLERYEAALGQLRPDDREAIIARIELGYSYDEVAEALGKPSIAAAQMAVSRALVRLAKEMAHARRK
jgi:RNA polymerase sigma-70 factor (ECF subfamily)